MAGSTTPFSIDWETLTSPFPCAPLMLFEPCVAIGGDVFFLFLYTISPMLNRRLSQHTSGVCSLPSHIPVHHLHSVCKVQEIHSAPTSAYSRIAPFALCKSRKLWRPLVSLVCFRRLLLRPKPCASWNWWRHFGRNSSRTRKRESAHNRSVD